MNWEQASAGLDGPWPVGKILIQRVYRRAMACTRGARAPRAASAGVRVEAGLSRTGKSLFGGYIDGRWLASEMPTSVRASAASAPHIRADGLLGALQAWFDEQRRPSPLQLFLVQSEYAKKNN